MATPSASFVSPSLLPTNLKSKYWLPRSSPSSEARFLGVEWQFGWVARYELQFWINSYERKPEIQEAVMQLIFAEPRKHGMSPGFSPKSGPDAGPGADNILAEEIRQAGE